MIADEVRALIADARQQLMFVTHELIGEVVTPRGWGIPRAPRVVLRDEGWRVGVLLLGTRDVYAVGDIVLSRQPARRGFTAETQRERAELSEAAYRGGILAGTPVHLGWRRLDLDALDGPEPAAAAPIAVHDGHAVVQWSAGAGYRDLAGYLAEQVDLRLHPPRSAT